MKPDHPVLKKSDYIVRNTTLQTGQTLVSRYHYAKGGSNTATFMHGLFHKETPRKCLGVAWWIPPTKSAAMKNYPKNWRSVLSLSRLVIRPDVPQNGASFLISKSIKLIKNDGRFLFLLTYADDWQGHTGTIYRATNWEFLGMTVPEATWIDEGGRMIARKAGGKTRTKHEMESLGYTMIGRFSRSRFGMFIG